jgi:hypothetical protein
MCIGMHFAMMEAVLVLATMASRFRLELAPGYKLKLSPSVTLRPQGGMPMILHQRQIRCPLVEAQDPALRRTRPNRVEASRFLPM